MPDPVAHVRGKKISVRMKGEEAETAALKRMKGLLSQMSGYDGSYEPEKNSAVYWKDFVVRHQGLLEELGGQAKVRAIIMAAGERWKARKIDVGI